MRFVIKEPVYRRDSNPPLVDKAVLVWYSIGAHCVFCYHNVYTSSILIVHYSFKRTMLETLRSHLFAFCWKSVCITCDCLGVPTRPHGLPVRVYVVRVHLQASVDHIVLFAVETVGECLPNGALCASGLFSAPGFSICLHQDFHRRTTFISYRGSVFDTLENCLLKK